MSAPVLLLIGVVWGSVLTFALALAYAADNHIRDVVLQRAAANAAEDFRPRLHGVAEVVPMRRRRGDAA